MISVMDNLSSDSIYEIFKHRPIKLDAFCATSKHFRTMCENDHLRDRIKLYWLKKYEKLVKEVEERMDTENVDYDENDVMEEVYNIMNQVFPDMPWWIGEEF